MLFAQKARWIEQYARNPQIFLRGIETDSLNNYYVLIEYTDTLTIDNFGSPITFYRNSYGKNICLLKYNCNNILQWTAKFKGANNDGCSMKIASNGNIYCRKI